MTAEKLAIVAIGRNEGERLRRCLVSARAFGDAAVVVYVDSGSTDDSVEIATSMGCEVVRLDMSIPFTAARARNEGSSRALTLQPLLGFVQFVDGDCEIADGWLTAAIDFLSANSKVAAVCGRRRERHPEDSIYNQLCDFEWATTIGDTRYCGGDVMMRVAAFKEVDGYRASMIAGEEPELCVRMRARGWRIWRLDHEMTMHDAAMTRFGQWWNRSKRAGHAFAEGAALHGAAPERHNVRETASALMWGVIVPLSIIMGIAIHPLMALLLLIYPLQIVRIAVTERQYGSLRWWRAFFLVAGKFPEAQGVLMYAWNRVRQRSASLIEYK